MNESILLDLWQMVIEIIEMIKEIAYHLYLKNSEIKYFI